MEILEIMKIPYYKKGKGIHIKKKNRGKFTEYCGGEVTNECILKAKKSKNPTLRKRATFALNARGWSKKHLLGGIVEASTSFIPIVGTYQSYQDYKKDPTLANLGWTVASGIGDVLLLTGLGYGLGSAIKGLKAANTARKAVKAVNTARKNTRAANQVKMLEYGPKGRNAFKGWVQSGRNVANSNQKLSEANKHLKDAAVGLGIASIDPVINVSEAVFKRSGGLISKHQQGGLVDKFLNPTEGILKYLKGTSKEGIKQIDDRLTEEDDERLWETIYDRFEDEDVFDLDIDFDNLEEKKDTSDVSEFFNSYLKSKGIKRILNNQKTWWENRHPYRKYISNFDLGTTLWIKDAQNMKPYIYTTNMPTTYSYAYASPKDSLKILVVGRKPASLDDYKFNFNFALGHEYAHGKKPFNFGYFGSYNEDQFDPDSAQAEALDLNKNTKEGHDSETDEKHSDEWGLKYLLYKEGIYDAREDLNITLDQVKELRKRYPNLRPIKQMSDELLMFQINHVAQNNQQDNNANKSYLAKKGIKLPIKNKRKILTNEL